LAEKYSNWPIYHETGTKFYSTQIENSSKFVIGLNFIIGANYLIGAKILQIKNCTNHEIGTKILFGTNFKIAPNMLICSQICNKIDPTFYWTQVL